VGGLERAAALAQERCLKGDVDGEEVRGRRRALIVCLRLHTLGSPPHSGGFSTFRPVA
jgi:hypothetical protein